MYKLAAICPLTTITSRKLYSTIVDVKEIKIPVPWGHIAGKWWGPTDQHPVLCLHGYLDNAAVFNRLIPLLSNKLSFLAVDLQGHGLSSHIPKGSSYTNIDSVLLIEMIKSYFHWDKVSLMGHSMGATSSFLYTLANPDNVNSVICLDGPDFHSFNDYLKCSCRIIREFGKYSRLEELQEEYPVLYSIDEIKRNLFVSYQKSIDYKYIHHVVERHAKPSSTIEGKYSISLDSRLKVGDSVFFSPQEFRQVVDKISSPIFIMYGTKMAEKINHSLFPVIRMLLEQKSRTSTVGHMVHKIKMDVSHHFHLNNPELIADSINGFLEINHKS